MSGRAHRGQPPPSAQPQKLHRQQRTGSLARLVEAGALSRAALGACGFALALLDANAPARPVTYVNRAFETLFGYAAGEAIGRPLAALLFRGDEPLVHRLLAEARPRSLRVWRKDGMRLHVQLTLGSVPDASGRHSHWILGFADRGEALEFADRGDIEALRNELEDLKALVITP